MTDEARLRDENDELRGMCHTFTNALANQDVRIKELEVALKYYEGADITDGASDDEN